MQMTHEREQPTKSSATSKQPFEGPRRVIAALQATMLCHSGFQYTQQNGIQKVQRLARLELSVNIS